MARNAGTTTPRLDRLWAPGLDADAERHRAVYTQVLGESEIDARLVRAMYDAESDASLNPFANDVEPVLRQINEAGLKIAILSDIHFDIRPAFEQAGLLDVVDQFVLSFEQGVQKPDEQIFLKALSLLNLSPREVLMVGDRAHGKS